MRVFTTITCLFAISALTNAGGVGPLLGGVAYAPKYSSLDYYAYPRYAFEYAVRDPSTGDNKAQWEKRDGDVVTGAYSLVEPDGTIRVVEYRADSKSGFNAVVKRIGPQIHPVTVPIYKAQIPVLGVKAVAPISVGPVAGIKGLAGAPLLTGPLYGKAISTASIINSPILKGIGPIIPSPIIPAVIKEPILPIIKEPIYPGPIIKEPILPIIKEPIYPGLIKEPILPFLKGPIYPGPLPIIKEPLYPSLPIIKEPLYPSLPIIKQPLYPSLPIIKEPLYPSLPIIKEPIYPGPIIKEPLLPIKGPVIPSYPILKGPLDLSLLGKYGLSTEALLGKGLLLGKGGLIG